MEMVVDEGVGLGEGRRRGRLLIMTHGTQGGNSLSINTHRFFARKSYFFKWRCSSGIIELVLFFCSWN